ncbi:MDR family MFS transporter [Rosenbergiella collisarenosi]|uniref:MDR family MFS transporter n=1 Tax=Rosenbergiella collisarenosi TaxID=1544695 RepID=UPI001F4FA8B1|nr:MDR family MFS transporter [Rosenbergiella collisarenosi]
MAEQRLETQGQQTVTRRQWAAILGGLLGGFMAVLDIQITNSSLKTIQGALSASMDDSSWLMTAYFTAEIIAIPLCGWLSRALGTSRYAQGCILLFIIASLSCAFAWNLTSMIIFRALQGFSGGGLIPIAFRLIIELLPQHKRPMGMAMFSVLATFAPAIGPALGGFLTEHLSWRALFYINLPPAVLAMGLIGYGTAKPDIRWQIIRQGDVGGIICSIVWLGCLEVVLEEGRHFGWMDSNLIITLSTLSFCAFLGFILSEITHQQPLINLRLLTLPSFSSGCMLFVLFGGAVYGTLFLVPYYLTLIHNYNAEQIGSVIIWMGLPQLLLLPFIPRLTRQFNLKYLVVFGFAMLSLSSFMDCMMSADFSGPQMKWSLLIRALGQPFIMVPLSMLTTRDVQWQDSASSAVIINVFRSLGGSCGTAIFTTIFVSQSWGNARKIQSVIPSSSTGFAHFQQQMTARLIQYGHSYSSDVQLNTVYSLLQQKITQQAEIISFNMLFFAMGCLMAAGVLLALFLNKKFALFNSQ